MPDLNFDNLQQIDKQLGSNPDGTYKDKITGESYYIKFPAQKKNLNMVMI